MINAKISANPIPYWLFGTESRKTKENLERAFKDLQEIGFSSVKADVPDGMSVEEYKAWVASYDLAPAFSLYNSTVDRTLPIKEDVEQAKKFAAQQAALGIDRTMLCPIFVPERLAQPAVGAHFDEGRFQNVIEDLAILAEALRGEGVFPYLHPHVGGWVEVEDEIRRVLDTIPASELGYGPDTGHQTWAGANPAELIRDYSDRVGVIHVKDVFPDHLGENRNPALSYTETAHTKRLWAEPGRGVVDLDAILDAMPVDYDGDFMIEVDVPSIDSVYDSLVESFEWAKNALEARIG